MNFWIISILLTFIITLLCFYPLLQKQGKSKSINRDELNKAFYFNRLQELDDDEKKGLVDNPNQLKTELQQLLLLDIPVHKQENKVKVISSNKIWFFSGFLSVLIIATVTYMQVGAWKEEVMLEKTHQKLPHFYERLKEEEINPLTDTELQQFTIALRLKLQKEPNNAADWWLLGQTAMAQENAQLAHDSYARAYKLSPNNIEFKLAYARILMFSRDESDKQMGMTLLREVLRKEHTNIQALSLLAFQYFEKEDYKMAANTWSIMLKLLPRDDSRVHLIEKSIIQANEAQKEKTLSK